MSKRIQKSSPNNKRKVDISFEQDIIVQPQPSSPSKSPKKSFIIPADVFADTTTESNANEVELNDGSFSYSYDIYNEEDSSLGEFSSGTIPQISTESTANESNERGENQVPKKALRIVSQTVQNENNSDSMNSNSNISHSNSNGSSNGIHDSGSNGDVVAKKEKENTLPSSSVLSPPRPMTVDHDPITSILGEAEVDQDARKYFVATKAIENNTLSLYQHYSAALHLCISILLPTFLTLIIISDILAVLFESQLIASVGLVYIFIFLIIIGSYMLAIVPYIIVLNALDNLFHPKLNKSGANDFIGVSILFAVVGMAVVYFNYGAKIM